jgi:hypothetical protein
MDIYIKNNRSDRIFFDLRDTQDEPPIKVTNLMNPDEEVRRRSSTGTMMLSIVPFEETGLKPFSNEWRGFVPAGTADPITIENNNGTMTVSIDETIIPNILSSTRDGHTIKICTIVGAMILCGAGYYIYCKAQKKKRSH